MDKINMTLGDFSQKLNPFAQKLNRSFNQVKQYAQEKMGNAEDVTKLPLEYIELEESVDKIKELHDSLLKVTKVYTRETHDYDQSLSESLFDTASKVSEKITTKSAEASNNSTVNNNPMSQGHAISRICLSSANAILSTTAEENNPFGVALKKISASYEKIGDERIKQDNKIVEDFWKPFNTTLTNPIAFAMKARKNVNSARLNYDACKHKLKVSKVESINEARTEMDAAENEFVKAVEDAMAKMKVVIESAEPLKNLNELILAQLEYHKRCYEILSELSPEVSELELNNEAMIREKTLNQ